MTLIIAIPAENGVVFASDSQVTTGAVRATGTKIYRLNDHAVWGASGEVALIQRFAEQLGLFPNRTQPLETIRDDLAARVKQAAVSCLAVDFRTQFFQNNPDALLGLHPGDFLFAECRDAPRILHILTNGTSEWVEGRFAATGNGELFAHALLQKYASRSLSMDQAKLLAYKVIEEAIEVVSFGLGPPIHVWEVTGGKTRQISSAEESALADSARILREEEVGLLRRLNVQREGSTVPAELPAGNA